MGNACGMHGSDAKCIKCFDQKKNKEENAWQM